MKFDRESKEVARVSIPYHIVSRYDDDSISPLVARVCECIDHVVDLLRDHHGYIIGRCFQTTVDGQVTGFGRRTRLWRLGKTAYYLDKHHRVSIQVQRDIKVHYELVRLERLGPEQLRQILDGVHALTRSASRY